MNFAKSLLVLAAVFGVTISASAQASVFISPDPLLGNLNIGDSGYYDTTMSFDVTGDAIPDTLHGYAYGTIPSNSKITFTYNFSPTLPTSGDYISTGTYLVSNGIQMSYYYSSSNGTNAFVAANTAFPTFPMTIIPINPDDMPVLAEADFKAGQTSVTNLAAGAAGFSTFFLGSLGDLTLTSVHYAVSAVPLPAALPLFGLGLVGLAAYGRRKKAA